MFPLGIPTSSPGTSGMAGPSRTFAELQLVNTPLFTNIHFCSPSFFTFPGYSAFNAYEGLNSYFHNDF